MSKMQFEIYCVPNILTEIKFQISYDYWYLVSAVLACTITQQYLLFDLLEELKQ